MKKGVYNRNVQYKLHTKKKKKKKEKGKRERGREKIKANLYENHTGLHLKACVLG